jgi:NADPH:quinone reductase-like Zn-dependent oxidoreductase
VESRAIVLERPGALPPPTVRAASRPKRGEVLLQVGATSVNFHDLLGVTGQLPHVIWPRVPFSDASGEVVELGDDVTGVAVGDRVIPNFFPRWSAGRPRAEHLGFVLGDHTDGALQTHVCVDARSLAPTPPHLDDTEAATLPCAGLTAWRALFVEARLQPGDTVVVLGTGGVSLFALGFAKLAGATVIATSSSDDKLEKARALGADHLVNYRRRPDWDSEVLEVTGGGGAEVILDVGGTATLSRSVNAAATDGHVACIGMLTGRESDAFPQGVIMRKNLTVRGITVGSRADLTAMCKAVAASRYRPVVDQVFGLSEAEAAMQRLVSQVHVGKIVISTSG